MKLLLEKWESFLKEGEVIKGPWGREKEEADPEVVNFMVNLESSLGDLLAKMYGGTDLIPFEKLEQLEEVVDQISTLLSKNEV